MKNKLSYLVLLILPIALLFLEIFLRQLRGEYFLYSGYDGVYGLLLSSLNIAQFEMPGYFQHPNIISQIISACIIKFTHVFQGKNSNMVSDVIERPEFYLAQINLFFVLFTILALYILGIVSYLKIGNIFAAIFIQLTPFVSLMIIHQLTQNTCETTSIILILILLSITINRLYEENMTNRKNIIYAIIFGIVCGLALSNKISIVPIMIIPFLLIKNFLNKGLFVLISFIIFAILLYSLNPATKWFWDALIRNVSHSGNYGSGQANVVDTNLFFPTLQMIINDFLFFSITYILIAIILIMQFIPRYKNKIRKNKYFLILIGILVIQSAFIFLLVKQPLFKYYLMPGIIFSVFGLFAVNSIFSDLFPKLFSKSKYLYIYICFFILMIANINSIKSSIFSYYNCKKESSKIVKYLEENYSNSIVVSTDFTSSMPTAFYEGLEYAGEKKMYYKSILNNKYPKYIYYQRWAKKFLYINNPDLIEKLINSGNFIYHSFSEASFIDFKKKLIEVTNKQNSTFEEIYSNNLGEKLYFVTLKE